MEPNQRRKAMNRRIVTTQPKQAYGHLTRIVRHLLERERPLGLSPNIWANLRMALEALPLSTDVFGLALNRLQNAKKYWEEGEWGAARFELQMFLAALKS
jgi:hypothetical protein